MLQKSTKISNEYQLSWLIEMHNISQIWWWNIWLINIQMSTLLTEFFYNIIQFINSQIDNIIFCINTTRKNKCKFLNFCNSDTRWNILFKSLIAFSSWTDSGFADLFTSFVLQWKITTKLVECYKNSTKEK